MADNVPITVGSGTNVATDEIGGVHTQRIKVQWGPDGTVNDADVATGKPLPVQLRGSDGTDRSNALPVTSSGAVAHDAVSPANPVVIGGFASAAAPADVSADGDAARAWVLRNGSPVVNIAAAGALIPGDATLGLLVKNTALGTSALDLGVSTGGSRTLRVAIDTTQVQQSVAHDADGTAILPIITGGIASAAAPTSVSADGDSVREWRLRNGAAATVLTAAGALVGGDATNGLDVDVTRVSGNVAVTHTTLTNIGAGEYETVAASQTNQVLGATGAAGDYLSHVVVSPATAGCGVVTILDNATAVVSFPGGGTTALTSLIPFTIYVGIISTSGAWKITTGANVSCVGVGNFT